ncbi:MAG: PD40 domain-containing protein [Pirellulales bacterium]|nr:PD40 domain-containing protein [Pirellulales bacterium]
MTTQPVQPEGQPLGNRAGKVPLAARWLALFGVVVATAGAAGAATPLGPGAMAPAPNGRILYVANADGRQIAVIDLEQGRVARRIAVPERPTGLALSPDGATLYVTCAAVKSTVLVIETASGQVQRTLGAGHTAMGPAVSPDGQRLYVCNRFDHNVWVIDLAAGEPIARIAAVREPIAAAVTPDGKSVLVINHLPTDRANSFYVAAAVTIIDAATHETTTVRLPNGATSVQGLCLSPDGRLAYVTHIVSNYELVPAQVDAGWTNTNVLSVLDTVGQRLINTVGLDDLYLGAGNPWGVACTADGESICVAHAGTHELSVIDAPPMLAKLGLTLQSGAPASDTGTGTVYVSPAVTGIPSSMGMLDGLRQRVALDCRGPRAVAVVGAKAYVAGYFSDTIDVVDLRPRGDADRTGAIALGPPPEPTDRRRGEMLFHDATICYQHWQSCSSCHPDARADVLNWDLRNDGVGNPKNTKSMLLAHLTPPAMATGVRPTGEAAVRAGILHTLFAERPEEEAAAIDEYLRSLRPVSSPYRVDGRLSPAARRGRRLFASDRVGCHRCHPRPLYTDRLLHDVGSQGPYDVEGRFDTPTLVEVWRTAPYLHDGRYTTIEALLVEGQHGLSPEQLQTLTPQEIRDLVAFVLSL